MPRALGRVLVLLCLLVGSNVGSSTPIWFLNQFWEIKKYHCQCRCASFEIRCKIWFCAPQPAPTRTCTKMFQDDCTESGFDDPCYATGTLCEGICDSP